MVGITLRVMALILTTFVVCTGADCLYRFYDLRNKITFALRVAELDSEQQLRKKVFAIAIRAGISCEERDIIVKRTETSVRAEVQFRYWVGVPFSSQSRGVFPLVLRASGERSW